MPEPRYDLGIVSSIKAEALGASGQRRFRLVALSPRGEAFLWLEKEQLLQLALSFRQVLEGTPSPPHFAQEEMGPVGSPGTRNFEFQVGRLALSYDAKQGLFFTLAYDIESPKAAKATLALITTRKQTEDLVEEALKVCAAGRPLCPICSLPMGPGEHHCPRRNGHTTPSS